MALDLSSSSGAGRSRDPPRDAPPPPPPLERDPLDDDAERGGGGGGGPLLEEEDMWDLEGAAEFWEEDAPPARGFGSAALYADMPAEREDIDDSSCLLLDIIMIRLYSMDGWFDGWRDG